MKNEAVPNRRPAGRPKGSKDSKPRKRKVQPDTNGCICRRKHDSQELDPEYANVRQDENGMELCHVGSQKEREAGVLQEPTVLPTQPPLMDMADRGCLGTATWHAAFGCSQNL
jgi:hypothetical protein